MSFVCQGCGNPQGSGIKPVQRVVAIRPVEYVDEDNKVIAQGTEIERELRLCPACAMETWRASPLLGEVHG